MVSRKIRIEKDVKEIRPQSEYLMVADAFSREKGLDREIAIEAMECAIAKAGRIKYGNGLDIIAKIDRSSGDVSIAKRVFVVHEVIDRDKEISLFDAKLLDENYEVGDIIIGDLPLFEFGRAAAEGARQIIFEKVREAERERQYADFVDRKGDILNGVVKNVDAYSFYVDFGKVEGVLKKSDGIPRQIFRVGDRIKVLLYDLNKDGNGPVLVLSRTHPDFLRKLFEQEVTEIYDGIIKIASVARDPGSRAKVAVYSLDHRVDVIGACVGVKGGRVQAIVNELYGEKVDIIQYSDDLPTFILNSFSSFNVKKVVIDEKTDIITVVTSDDSYSQAIGRRGQNVRLVSILVGKKIVVEQESIYFNKGQNDDTGINELVNVLDINEEVAKILLNNGLTSVYDIAEELLVKIESISGIDFSVAKKIHEKAKEFVVEKESMFFKKCKDFSVNDDLLVFENLTIDDYIKLIDFGVHSKEDLANLSSTELIDILGENVISDDEANEIILNARSIWFSEDDSEKNAN